MKKLLLLITLFTSFALSASLPPEFSAIADVVAYKYTGESTKLKSDEKVYIEGLLKIVQDPKSDEKTIKNYLNTHKDKAMIFLGYLIAKGAVFNQSLSPAEQEKYTKIQSNMKKIKEEEFSKIYQDNAQEIKALVVSILRDMLDNGIPKADLSLMFGTNMGKSSFKQTTTYSKKTARERKKEALKIKQSLHKVEKKTSEERKKAEALAKQKADAAYLEAIKDL